MGKIKFYFLKSRVFWFIAIGLSLVHTFFVFKLWWTLEGFYFNGEYFGESVSFWKDTEGPIALLYFPFTMMIILGVGVLLDVLINFFKGKFGIM